MTSSESDTEAAKTAPDRGVPQRELLRLVGMWARSAFVANAALKFVALVLSVTLFILVNTDEPVTIPARVKVTYTYPDSWVPVKDFYDELQIKIRGSWRRTKRFFDRELEPIPVDLSRMKSGVFVFREDMIRLPSGLEFVSFTSPAIMEVEFENKIARQVPVFVNIEGQPEPGYKLERVVVEPAVVTVEGAESVVDGLSKISTNRVSITGKREFFRRVVSLLTRSGITKVQPAEAEVSVFLAEVLTRKEIADLSVAVRTTPGMNPAAAKRIAPYPDKVSVVVHGSPGTVEQTAAQSITPYVIIFPSDLSDRKEREAEVRVNVEGVGVEIKPRVVRLRRAK